MLPPFEHHAEVNAMLSQRYPDAEMFARACKKLSVPQRTGVLRAFITEGVPSAFEELPTLYEGIRGFLAARLSVNPEDVTLVGSARLGYSLAPPPSYGTPFSPNSDLDFAVVSSNLFQASAQVFAQWKADVAAGREITRNAREERFWTDNLKRVPLNIERGFIDANKVPNRYELSMKVGQTMWQVKDRLARTPMAPQVRRASLRIYRDWSALFRQQLLSLRAAISGFPADEASK
jgi:hypothetical protein